MPFEAKNADAKAACTAGNGKKRTKSGMKRLCAGVAQDAARAERINVYVEGEGSKAKAICSWGKEYRPRNIVMFQGELLSVIKVLVGDDESVLLECRKVLVAPQGVIPLCLGYVYAIPKEGVTSLVCVSMDVIHVDLLELREGLFVCRK